ncbi:unnamed protein product [Alternaria alternata]
MARQLRREDYTVGWVCALPVELAAADKMLDEVHLNLECDPADNDQNLYTLGSIGGHNVAIVCLHAGQIGNNSAATVATQMRATFKNIRFGLMVGIAGGVPSAEADVRLGDVVVSQPQGEHGGVVQYDSGKATLSGFKRVGSLNSPPKILLAAVARVRANELGGRGKLSEHVAKLEGIPKFQRSNAGSDVLFEATYGHKTGQTCDKCNPSRQLARMMRDSGQEVAIHYGTIASGDQVIKDAAVRDKLSAKLGGVLCFEMEAAGLMNIFACLVIRGICDYADSHKNKRWQAYAAGTAAAYAKEVLSVVPPEEVAKSRTAMGNTQESPSNSQSSESDLLQAQRANRNSTAVNSASTESSSQYVFRLPPARKLDPDQHNLPRDVVLPRQDERGLTGILLHFLSVYAPSFHHYDYLAHLQDISRQRYQSTCSWALRSDPISWLCAKRVSSILWMSGCHGLGKSTILAHLVDELLRNEPELNVMGKREVIYSFCSDQKNNTASMVLSTAIHQLLVHHPEVQPAILRFDQTNFFGKNLVQPSMGKNRPTQNLWTIFVEIVREAKLKMLFLIVDGLDHCNEQSQNELMREFQSALCKGPCIKILFSSTKSDNIKKHFFHIEARHPEDTKHQELEDLDDHINDDIGIYVSGEVARISKDDQNPLSPTEQDRIEEKLLHERSGAFLPVALLLREIEERGDRTVAEILEDIPKTLQALYQDIVSQISTELHGRQIPALKYLLYCAIPLTLRDLAYACYVMESLSITANTYSLPNDVELQALTSLKKNLWHLRTIIKWRNDRELVTFIHPTSKQYLIHRTLTDDAEPFLPKSWHAHGQIAGACLRLVLATSELDLPQFQASSTANEPRHRMIRDRPLLRYALQYWSTHLKEAIDKASLDEDIYLELMQLIRRFIVIWNLPPDGFRFTLLAYWGIEGLTEFMANDVSIIEVFSGLGLTRCLKTLLENPPFRYRTVDLTIRRAVLLTIRGGHEESFDLLVSHFDITSLEGAEYQHIISASAWSRHFSLLVKTMRLRKLRLQEHVEAIDIAFATGNLATLNELTKDKAIFEMRDQQGRTCLHQLCISQYGHNRAHPRRLLAVVNYMLDNRVDVNAHGRFGFTALHYVCWSPYLCVADLIENLIRRGADVFATSKGGLTPFHLAVFATREPEVVQLFLRLTSYQIAGVKSKGHNTPLHWAVQRRYTAEDKTHIIEETPYYLILKLLVHAGADPHVQNGRGLTATESARYRHVQSLLISTYENAHQIRYSELVLPKLKRYQTWAESEQADHKQLVPQEFHTFVEDDGDSQDAESFYTAQETSQSDPSIYEHRNALSKINLH